MLCNAIFTNTQNTKVFDCLRSCDGHAKVNSPHQFLRRIWGEIHFDAVPATLDKSFTAFEACSLLPGQSAIDSSRSS